MSVRDIPVSRTVSSKDNCQVSYCKASFLGPHTATVQLQSRRRPKFQDWEEDPTKKRLRKPYNSDQDYFSFPHPHFEGSGGLVAKGLRGGVPRVIGDLWAPGRVTFTTLVSCAFVSSCLTLKTAPYLQISSACWASRWELPSLGESLEAPDVCISGEVSALISRGIVQGVRFIYCRFEII